MSLSVCNEPRMVVTTTTLSPGWMQLSPPGISTTPRREMEESRILGRSFSSYRGLPQLRVVSSARNSTASACPSAMAWTEMAAPV